MRSISKLDNVMKIIARINEYSVEPDIAMFSEALGNAHANSAVSGNQEVMVSAQSTLYFLKALKPREMVTRDPVRDKRPEYGIARKHLEPIIGLPVKNDVRIGMAVARGLLC